MPGRPPRVRHAPPRGPRHARTVIVLNPAAAHAHATHVRLWGRGCRACPVQLVLAPRRRAQATAFPLDGKGLPPNYGFFPLDGKGDLPTDHCTAACGQAATPAAAATQAATATPAAAASGGGDTSSAASGGSDTSSAASEEKR